MCRNSLQKWSNRWFFIELLRETLGFMIKKYLSAVVIISREQLNKFSWNFIWIFIFVDSITENIFNRNDSYLTNSNDEAMSYLINRSQQYLILLKNFASLNRVFLQDNPFEISFFTKSTILSQVDLEKYAMVDQANIQSLKSHSWYTTGCNFWCTNRVPMAFSHVCRTLWLNLYGFLTHTRCFSDWMIAICA